MPSVEHIIQSYDTAYTKKETSDYSAITTWGVFYLPDSPNGHLILMDAEKGRWEFPELKRVAIEKYKKYNPDTVIIEAKASGLPLTHELRQLGIPIVNYTPSRGNDKHARVNAVSPLFEGGMIWAPMSHAAQEVVDECAAFPNGDHDDYVDSTVQAVLRYRQANFIRLKDDYEDEKKEKPRRVYY
jgi:predicted phage terminase large subunit-like protein